MTGDITTNDSFAFGDDDGDDAFQIEKCLSEKKNIYYILNLLLSQNWGFLFYVKSIFHENFREIDFMKNIPMPTEF